MRPDVAVPDVLQALERELAGHPVFGDAPGILDRTRTLTLMRLEALSRRWTCARELFRELRKEGSRRAAADVLADPVVRGDCGGSRARAPECTRRRRSGRT